MPQSFAPFGLRPVAAMGTHGNEVRAYAAPNGASCPALAKGTPVKWTNGVVASTGTGTGPLLGVVQGVAWINDTTKLLQNRSYLPAATSSGGLIDGDNRPQVYVVDSPEALFMVQANASLSAGDAGLNFEVTATAADAVDTVMGISRMALKATSRTSAVTGAVKVLGLARIPDNNWDDPFPVVVCRLNSIIAQVSAA